MDREDIEVTPGQTWMETLPVVKNGQSVDLSGYEVQLQFRSLSGELIGLGTATVDGSTVKLSASAALIALLSGGTATLYGVLIRPLDHSWQALLQHGAVKKAGVGFPWQ